MANTHGTFPEPAEPVTQRELWALPAIAALPILVKLLCYWDYPGSDDVFTHLTIARNVTQGLGWGLNPNEPMNLSSSPLFTVLLSLAALCGIDPFSAGVAISAAAGMLSVVAVHRLLLLLELPALGRIGGAVFAASNVYLWRWNAVVMETTLALLLLTLAFCAFQIARRRESQSGGTTWYFLTGGVAGLAFLTRFELALLVACFCAAQMAFRPRRWIRSIVLLAGGFAIFAAPWFIFSVLYFGALLPTPFYARTSACLLLWNPSIATDLLKLVVSASAVPLLTLAAFFCVAVARGEARQRINSILRPLEVWLFPLGLAAFCYIKMPVLVSPARYFLPALHVLAVVFAYALYQLGRAVPTKSAPWLIAATLLSHLAVSLAFNQMKVAPVLARFAENYQATMRTAADVVRNNQLARERGALVVVDIGILSYYAGPECYIHDGGGLASPHLRTMNIRQQIEKTKAGVVVDTGGGGLGDLSRQIPALQLVWRREFKSHAVGQPDAVLVCSVYEHRP